MLDAETVAVVRHIELARKFSCIGQSFMKTPGEIVSLVMTYYPNEVHLISYNQAKDSITTIRNYGE